MFQRAGRNVKRQQYLKKIIIKIKCLIKLACETVCSWSLVTLRGQDCSQTEPTAAGAAGSPSPDVLTELLQGSLCVH